MKIEDHIIKGIDAFVRGEQEHALLHACIAIDGTSQKKAEISNSDRSTYIQFIRNYYWILEPMAGSGINFDETFWKNINHKDQNGKPVENIDIAAFIYYMFRCTQAHGKTIPEQYKLVSKESSGDISYHIAENRLHLPETIIWGLFGICIFSKTNKDINTNTDHHLTLGKNVFALTDWWGLEDSFRPIALKYNQTRVTLEGLGFSNKIAQIIVNS